MLENPVRNAAEMYETRQSLQIEADNEAARQAAERNRLMVHGMYDPASERDACGVGLVCAIDGKPRREVVELAIKALKAVWHRGAVDADGQTGDGAGIMLGVPQDFFREQVQRTGHSLREGPIAVGQIFLPRVDLNAQELARTIVESEALRFGFYIYGWRQVPVDTAAVGAKANATRPEIEQIMLAPPPGMEGADLERALFLCRKRIEKRVAASNIPHFYICSFSAKSLIYKGMFLAEAIDAFYPDLRDERFSAAVAIFHQRYSTNTFPEWRLAQPFRMLAHNGEINTLKGNVNWMRSHEIRMAASAFGAHEEVVKPVVQPGYSDSSALDNVFEVLVRAGRDAPMAKALLMPEAWNARPHMKPEHQALYAYCNAVMEPWDGPAAICATDGRWVIGGKDRNGLRPLRMDLTEDGLLILGSEAGLTGVDERRIVRKGSIPAGRMVAVDLQEGRFYGDDAIVDHLSERHPYRDWLGTMVDLEKAIGPGPEPRRYERQELTRRQAAAGYSLEDLELLLAPMVEEAKEAIGSMGDDTPLAVLSERYRPLSHFFRQNFSQVTNPPIDPLRETGVMSLKTRFKNLGNVLAEDATQADVYVMDSPVVTTGMYERMLAFMGERSIAVIDCSMPMPAAEARPGDALRANLDRIRAEAEDAALSGRSQIVLTDENSGPDRLALPMILAVGGVHSHLVAKGLRSYVSLIVRSAECLDTHYFAVLVGVGATAVNAYLAQESFQDRLERGLSGELTLRDVCLNYKKAVEAGLLKILSKMGISVISSYRGGYNFEAVGLSRALVAEFFPGMPSRISGIGLAGIERKALEMHRRAWQPDAIILPVGGLYKARRSGETHAFEAKLIHQLQAACDTADYGAYKRWSEGLRALQPVQLRDLLDIRTQERTPVPLHEVESVNEIRKRFVTPGMSLGALSPEAHGTLNIAMNRIGAKSVSGEGGEDPARYKPLPNGDNPNSAIKQIASGRFGVTAEYLNQAREIEIKVAQGAKPGEGGQLPGFKVTELIAKLRHATPGVTLISPPPHHDIYSIEDLAQLIYDLKQINPTARVCVKLVSMSGIGPIAAGVAKAKADVILISGHVGGTGASPQTSIKYAGAPWEMGLSEANQVLTLNNLRSHVRLRTDGGLRTGRDVVIAALLGAEEFGIGTASLIAMGCIMVRQCHSNTCPVGVCTQDAALRGKFTGTPEKVINLFTFIAEEVREILGRLGARSLQEIVGRTDLLAQFSRGGEHLDDLDLNPLLVRADPGPNKPYCTVEGRNEVPDTLDAQIVRDAAPLLERGEKMQLTYTVRNTQRAIGTRTSSHIVRKFGLRGLPSGHLTVQLRGSAGQSLGAFAAQGLRIELTGDANDYVAKGLSGATIVVRPSPHLVAPETNVILGNTVLYGATSGRLFAAGRAGERFAVRNSGAVAVVEGVGSNGCEYMTGGAAVILGEVGDNFAAGMTGGMAYVLDLSDRFLERVNPESVLVQRLASPYWEGQVRSLVAEHARETGSRLATDLLRDWDRLRASLWQVCPREMVSRLQHPLSAEAELARA
jgi:glutamate synthase (NADPH/NADH) large chain